jgi:hypothetical protein
MFETRRRKALQHERAQLRTRARAAMVAGKGFYNVHPLRFVLGILAAVFATLLTLDWLLRVPPEASPAVPASAYEIPVELE